MAITNSRHIYEKILNPDAAGGGGGRPLTDGGAKFLDRLWRSAQFNPPLYMEKSDREMVELILGSPSSPSHFTDRDRDEGGW